MRTGLRQLAIPCLACLLVGGPVHGKWRGVDWAWVEPNSRSNNRDTPTVPKPFVAGSWVICGVVCNE